MALTFALLLSPFSSMASGLVSNYAVNSGYTACLSAVVDLEKFFTEDTNYGSWSFVAKEGADDQVLNATLELSYEHDSALVDFSIAPTKDGSCTYVYTRTIYSNKSCMATSKEEFMAKSEYKGEVNKFITAFDETGGAKLLLMPAGSGCIVQKKEIGFRHSRQGT